MYLSEKFRLIVINRLKSESGGTILKVTVKLDCIAAVKNFNAIVNSFETNMDLLSGKYRVDAKSIMGVFSLDLSKTLTLEIHGQDSSKIVEALTDFIVEK